MSFSVDENAAEFAAEQGSPAVAGGERLEPASSAREKHLLWWAIGGSFIFHSGLLLALLLFRSDESRNGQLITESAHEAEQLAIRFVSQNPQRRAEETIDNPAPAAEADESEMAVAANSLPAAETEREPETTAPVVVSPIDDAALASESVQAPVSNPLSQSGDRPGDRPALLVPSLTAVRDSVQQLNNQAREQAWRSECNPLQEEAEILDCGNGSEPDYSAARNNAIYSALNPTFTLSRTQRSIPVAASERASLDGRLGSLVEAGDLPSWLGDYAMQQLDRTISDESGNGNRVVDHMIQMTDKSEAAQQARIMFGDAWLQNTMREQARRDVHRQ